MTAKEDLDYWDEDNDYEAVEPAEDLPPLNLCQCAKHEGVACQRTDASEADGLCSACRDGNCIVFSRPGHDPIHSRGLKRGKRIVQTKHEEDLRNTLAQLRSEHAKDAELSGDEPSTNRLYPFEAPRILDDL